MDVLVEIGKWIYNYCTDFCLNMSYLLGIDYVTFGSLFFGYFMNIIILLFIFLNLKLYIKNEKNDLKSKLKTNT
jgi:hypothetical protein